MVQSASELTWLPHPWFQKEWWPGWAFFVGASSMRQTGARYPPGYSPEPLWTASFRILSSLLNSAMRELLHSGRGMKRRSSWSAMCCRAESSSWFSAGWARSWKEGMDSQVLNLPICKMGYLLYLFHSWLWGWNKVMQMKFSGQCIL